jgi:phage-related protein
MVVFYQDEDGTVPLLAWLDQLPAQVQAKCLASLTRLEDLGHELRRPEADYLRDGIYELRVRRGTVHYRMLYFFHGQIAAVVSHGLTKERVVPARDIARALEHKQWFTAAQRRHTFTPERAS